VTSLRLLAVNVQIPFSEVAAEWLVSVLPIRGELHAVLFGKAAKTLSIFMLLFCFRALWLQLSNAFHSLTSLPLAKATFQSVILRVGTSVAFQLFQNPVCRACLG